MVEARLVRGRILRKMLGLTEESDDDQAQHGTCTRHNEVELLGRWITAASQMIQSARDWRLQES